MMYHQKVACKYKRLGKGNRGTQPSKRRCVNNNVKALLGRVQVSLSRVHNVLYKLVNDGEVSLVFPRIGGYQNQMGLNVTVIQFSVTNIYL